MTAVVAEITGEVASRPAWHQYDTGSLSIYVPQEHREAFTEQVLSTLEEAVQPFAFVEVRPLGALALSFIAPKLALARQERAKAAGELEIFWVRANTRHAAWQARADTRLDNYQKRRKN